MVAVRQVEEAAVQARNQEEKFDLQPVKDAIFRSKVKRLAMQQTTLEFEQEFQRLVQQGQLEQ